MVCRGKTQWDRNALKGPLHPHCSGCSYHEVVLTPFMEHFLLLTSQDPLIGKPLAPLPTDPQSWISQLVYNHSCFRLTNSLFQSQVQRTVSLQSSLKPKYHKTGYFDIFPSSTGIKKYYKPSKAIICREFLPFFPCHRSALPMFARISSIHPQSPKRTTKNCRENFTKLQQEQFPFCRQLQPFLISPVSLYIFSIFSDHSSSFRQTFLAIFLIIIFSFNGRIVKGLQFSLILQIFYTDDQQVFRNTKYFWPKMKLDSKYPLAKNTHDPSRIESKCSASSMVGTSAVPFSETAAILAGLHAAQSKPAPLPAHSHTVRQRCRQLYVPRSMEMQQALEVQEDLQEASNIMMTL